MKEPRRVTILAMAIASVIAAVCPADTFRNRQTGETLHGYASSRDDSGQIAAHTQEKGLLKLNTGQWEITRDKLGRNNKVIVLPVESDIMYELETTAFDAAMASAAEEGPLLILVEIDTPGGRVDLAQRMCTAVTKMTGSDVIAFVNGNRYGGAISAGAAVALSCSKIYMAPNTVIGAATLVVPAAPKEATKEKSYDAVVDEKLSSLWRAYLASLAQQNSRPGLLARAMVDRDIEVAEVNQAGKRLFIEPVNKKPEQQVVRTWNKAGSLLTLTAQEAVECAIADGMANSRQELLQQLQASDANVIVDKKIPAARRQIDLVLRKVQEIRKSLDLRGKQLEYAETAPRALAILRGARSDFENLKELAEKYPDVHVDIRAVEEELNSINAAYEGIIDRKKSRR